MRTVFGGQLVFKEIKKYHFIIVGFFMGWVGWVGGGREEGGGLSLEK